MAYSSTTAPVYQSVLAFIQSREDMQFLQQAVNISGLSSVLGNSSYLATWYLPVDKAWKQLVQQNVDNTGYSVEDLLEPTNMPWLVNTLFYHSVPQRIVHDGYQNGQVLDTASGSCKLKVMRKPSGQVLLVDEYRRAAVVTEHDILAGNSVANVVSGVLLRHPQEPRPDFPSVVAALESNREVLGVLHDAVQRPFLRDVLELLEDPREQFTVFAPVDEAFQRLVSNLGISLEELLDNEELLLRLVMYHIVPTRALRRLDLGDGMQLATSDGQQRLSIAVLGPPEYHQVEAKGSTAGILVPDVTGGRAVLHVIDTVLLPRLSTPSPLI